MSLTIQKIAHPRPYPPRVSEFTKPFWEALGGGRLTTTRCRACGAMTFPAKVICPHCWSDGMEWVDMPTSAVLYSWTRIHAAPTVFQHMAPYAVGIVELDGCLRLACPLVVAEGMSPQIGNRVEMTVLAFEDGPLFAAEVQAG